VEILSTGPMTTKVPEMVRPDETVLVKLNPGEGEMTLCKEQ
jgi:hypothetical protein